MTVCVYAMTNLKSNSSRLLVTMCVGIALALYGMYVQSRTNANPAYVPAISSATQWMVGRFGSKMGQKSGQMLRSCQAKQLAGGLLARGVLKPAIQYSGLINGLINILQIVLLKLKHNDLRATVAIGAMSILGFLVSMVCLAGAIGSCKTMCISCLGIHHLIIIYFIVRRYRIVKNMQCPTNGLTNGASCTIGSSGGITGRIFGSANSNASGQSEAKSSSEVRRRKP